MADIRLEGVSKRYGEHVIVRALDLEVRDGELVVLVGPSGCGKSTILRMIAGLLEPSAGRILIGGKDVTRRAPGERDLAMVFQSYALYPHLTVEENIGFPLSVRGWDATEKRERVREVAATLGLTEMLARLPRDLSGGQRQRVAMGRAIIREPRAFLFDEPLSNLDAALRARMRAEIADLHRRLGATMIYVTHDQHEAMTLADRLVLLRGGVVAQQGAPLEVYRAPNHRFVGEFLGNPPMNFLPASVRDGALQCAGVTLDAAQGAAGEVWLGVRPEHVALARDGERGLPATVAWVERTGSEAFLHARVGPDAIVARLDPNLATGLEPGRTIALRMVERALFDRESGARR